MCEAMRYKNIVKSKATSAFVIVATGILLWAISTFAWRYRQETLDSRLLICVYEDDVPGTVRALTDGANPNTTDKFAIHYVGSVIRSRFDHTVPDAGDGCTPLMLAVEHEDIELVRLLLGAGAKTKTKDDSGCDAIERAKRIHRICLPIFALLQQRRP